MKRYFLIIVIVLLQACESKQPGSWRNQEIKPQLREEIAQLNEQLIASITAQDKEKLKTLLSPKLQEKFSSQMPELIAQLKTVVENGRYDVLDEYHKLHIQQPESETLVSGNTKLNDYAFRFKADSPENYTSLLLFQNPGGQMLLACIYSKYEEGWKLNILKAGPYALNGKTAPELYEQAREKYAKRHYIDATNLLATAAEITKPGGKFWQYQVEAEMIALHQELLNIMQQEYPLPMKLNAVSSQPTIIRLHPQKVEEGIFPAIVYETSIDLNDTAALKKENEELHTVAARIFKGIDQEKEFLFYQAIDPKSGESKGFVKQL
jgi:hypothetical protein